MLFKLWEIIGKKYTMEFALKLNSRIDTFLENIQF